MGLTLSPMVRNILLGTIAIYLLQFVFRTWFIPVFGLHSFLSSYFYPFQLVTYIFLHDDQTIGHIFSNMFGLVIFGPMLERVWGPGRFLMFYLITGIGAGLIQNGINYYEMTQMQESANQYLLNPQAGKLAKFLSKYIPEFYQEKRAFLQDFENNPSNIQYIQMTKGWVREVVDLYLGNPQAATIGASGALFGLMAAFALLFPNTELYLLFIPFPIKAKYFVLLYGLFEYYSGIHRTEGDNVAHFAHLGGMLFGFILVRLWSTNRQNFY